MTVTTATLISDVTTHGFQDYSTPTILALLNDTLNEFYAEMNGLPFYEKTVSLTGVANADSVTGFPADFSKFIALTDMSALTKLVRSRRETVEGMYVNDLSLTGDPVWYYWWANALHVYPLFPDTRTVQMDYIRLPTQMVNGGGEVPDMPAIHARILLLGAVAKAMYQEDDFDMGDKFQNQFDVKLAKIKQDLWTWTYDRSDVIVDVFENDSDYW